MRVVWGYHSEDPVSEDNIPYPEDGQRGVKSMFLLQGSPPSVMPPDVTKYDFRVSNVSQSISPTNSLLFVTIVF